MEETRWRIACCAVALTIGLCARLPAQVTLNKNRDLAFGSMIAGTSAGTVSIATSGAVTSTGGVTLIPSTTSSAAFTLANPASGTNRFYFISLPGSVTISSGSSTMTVNGIANDPPNIGAINAGTSRVINVGATLNVGANQASGVYTGTFTLTVFLF